MIAAFIVALLLVAIAELGDKTQLLTLVLAARHGARTVLAGVGLAVLALQLLAVTVGGLVSALVPQDVMAWVTGALFVGFGVWTWVKADAGDGHGEDADDASGRHPVLGIAGAFFVAELGDKTQIMTMAIAADPGSAARSLGALSGRLAFGATGTGTLVAVWLGSVLGMMVVNGAAALIGTAVGERMPAALLGKVSAVIFIGFGLLAVSSQVFGG